MRFGRGVFQSIKMEEAKTLGFIDTHTHIHSTMRRLKMNLSDKDAFLKVLDDQVVKWNTKNAEFNCQLEAVVNVYCEPEDYLKKNEAGMQLMDIPFVYGACGIHPHEAKHFDEELKNKLLEALKHKKCVAVGECGLDYHYSHSPHDVQKRVFEEQLGIGVELGKPIVVHSREAEEDTIEIMKRCVPKDHIVHLHCFTSSPKMATELLEYFDNLYVGFTGVVTFKNAKEVREAVKVIPIERLLLETDAPFMAPTPYRGKVCHSAMAVQTAMKLCEIKGVDVEKGMKQLVENAHKVYKINKE